MRTKDVKKLKMVFIMLLAACLAVYGVSMIGAVYWMVKHDLTAAWISFGIVIGITIVMMFLIALLDAVNEELDRRRMKYQLRKENKRRTHRTPKKAA